MPEDIRHHIQSKQVLRIHIECEVMLEHELPSFLPQLGDDLAEMLTKRLNSTPGLAHVHTPEWDVSLQ